MLYTYTVLLSDNPEARNSPAGPASVSSRPPRPVEADRRPSTVATTSVITSVTESRTVDRPTSELPAGPRRVPSQPPANPDLEEEERK